MSTLVVLVEAVAADDAVQVGHVHHFLVRCVRQEYNVLFPAFWAIRAERMVGIHSNSPIRALATGVYQRPPLLRRSPPALGTRSGLGRASLTFNVRPLNWVPSNAVIALSA